MVKLKNKDRILRVSHKKHFIDSLKGKKINGLLVENKRNWNMKKTIYAFFKRVLGFTVALCGIILLFPIIIIVSIAIKCDSKGPVIFKQKRTGKNGEIFKVWKFRTMYVDNDVRDFSKADRRTRVGKFLRKTSLDEIPQFFNILFGQMAFIGPRPWIPEYYDFMNDEQRQRTQVLPGITGLAQAKGRNNIDIFKKIDYDLEYIDNYSFKEDIKIIFLTMKTVISKTGADAGKSTIKKELNALKISSSKIENIAKMDI